MNARRASIRTGHAGVPLIDLGSSIAFVTVAIGFLLPDNPQLLAAAAGATWTDPECCSLPGADRESGRRTSGA